MKSSGLRMLAIIVFLLAFAGANVGSFLLGRASAEHNSVSWEEASVFYAQIVERRENTLLVEGLPVNDVNHRGQFSFTLGRIPGCCGAARKSPRKPCTPATRWPSPTLGKRWRSTR